MNKNILLLTLMIGSIINVETDLSLTARVGIMPIVDNVVSLGVSLENQIDYVRKLAVFIMKQEEWKHKFSDNLCPEFTEVEIINGIRYCTKTNPEPIPPLPPVTVCEVNKQIPECNYLPPSGNPTEEPKLPDPTKLDTPLVNPNNGTINPDCEATPRLCLPPTICDLPHNQFNNDCRADNRPDCTLDENFENDLCVYTSKCDIDDFNHEGCEDKNPCRSHPELCLTACDREELKGTKRCIVERCNLFPDLEECAEFEHCKIDPVCLGDDIMTDNRCCPEGICNPVCLEDDVTCNPVDPVDECTWGINIADAIIDILIEPIQKQEMDGNGIVGFLECFNEYVKEKKKLVLECFYDELGTGYQELSKSLAETIEEMTAGYEVTYEVDEEGRKVINMEKNETNPARD